MSSSPQVRLRFNKQFILKQVLLTPPEGLLSGGVFFVLFYDIKFRKSLKLGKNVTNDNAKCFELCYNAYKYMLINLLVYLTSNRRKLI